MKNWRVYWSTDSEPLLGYNCSKNFGSHEREARDFFHEIISKFPNAALTLNGGFVLLHKSGKGVK